MQLIIRRSPSEHTSYSMNNGRGTRYVRAEVLKRWLLKHRVSESTIAAVLKIRPKETATIEIATAA